MSVINDIAKKIKPDYKPSEPIYVHAPTETLICRICGEPYFSRGKHDIGICRKCEAEQNANCIGGPYDGEPAHDGN